MMGKLSFIGAAERGRLDVIRQMLVEGVDINMTNSRGHNALRGAVREGHKDVVKYLLDRGADIDSESEMGWTAVYIAARNGDEKMVNILISRGASVVKGTPPVVAAVEVGSVPVARVLLDAGANVDAIDDNDLTALYIAVKRQDEQMVELLLGAGADANLRFHKRWFHETAFYEVDETVLHVAAVMGNDRIIQRLLDASSDPNAPDKEGKTALDIAFENGHSEVIVRLAKLMRKRMQLWDTLLAIAVEDQNISMLEPLLSVVDADLIAGTLGRQLLAAALRKKRCGPSMLELLLRHGADINAPDADGRTLLHEAADIGPKRISRLLKRGANLNVRDRAGRTPLHDAACCNEAVVRCLLEAGADPNIVDEDGMTPLHLAAAGIADQLNGMSFTISVSVGDDDRGEESVIEGDDESDVSAQITKMLLLGGANVNVRAHDGSTPLSVAEDERIISLLKDIS